MSAPVRGRDRLRTLAPLALGLLGLAAAVWATWLNLAGAQAAAAPTPTPRPPALQPALPPYQPAADTPAAVTRRASLHTEHPDRPRLEVLTYTVQKGDTVFGIAEKFGLKPETILWGNFEDLQDDPHLLRPGQRLNILPVDGVYYRWQEGDTLEGVAAAFGVEPRDIVDWPGNHLDPLNPQIEPGTWLVVPGGRRPLRQWVVPTIARGRAGVGAALGPGACSGDFSGGAVGTGGFIWPVASRTVSGNDYWAGHLALDLAAGVGEPVFAADSGVVVFAGWSYGGYGNLVVLDHGNGWQTVYAHLSQVLVGCGQSVAQGQRIALAGSTGNSTGPHLHFEIRLNGGFVNPWFVLP